MINKNGVAPFRRFFFMRFLYQYALCLRLIDVQTRAGGGWERDGVTLFVLFLFLIPLNIADIAGF